MIPARASATGRSHGSTAPRPGPVRTCVGCRVRSEVTGLLRVVARGSSVVPDPRRRLPGRGAHVHPDPECVALAERRRAFPRALRVAGPLDTAAVGQHVHGTPLFRQDPPGSAPVDTR